MKTQADYRKLAEDCVRLAQTAKETHRAMLLNMANTWLQFADQGARDHQWVADGPDARSDNHPRRTYSIEENANGSVGPKDRPQGR
jgi:hypothetical protein